MYLPSYKVVLDKYYTPILFIYEHDEDDEPYD